ncbi:MinD/ParA family protein [Actinomadura sp. KC216]|uniref:MinD/ParA family ATP-binding protein n=1 Tax=Actinomadura sp. KC216 TaxID=2530370 RepID=UPI001FB6788C|nr:MinD/ParA family protein [Actinomadura sp. KC216]
MLPPPYPATQGGYQGYDQPQPPQGAQEAPYPPQQPQYDANGNSAPPLEQLPPYPSDQFTQQDPAATYQPIDPATGQPYPQDTDGSGQPYVPFDPQTGQALDPNTRQPYAQQVDPNTGQPYQQVDPNTGQPYQQVDPNTGQPYQQVDPNTGQPYQQVDPNTGQPYAPQFDPNTGQPYQQFDPNTGQPYAQFDPNTGQPYAQDPNAAGQQYPPVDPNTGQPYGQQIDPNTGQPYQQQVDPNTGQPYQQVDPNTGQPYQQQVDPNTGQPYGQQFDPNTGQPYQQYQAVDPNTGQAYQQVDPNTGQPLQGYAYPQQPQQGPQQQMPQQPQNADSLSSENLLGERRIAPSSGWRRAVYKATAGNIHPGESQGDLRRKDLIARARTLVAGGHHRVAVMSLKGGVGKTTTTTGLGSMLGSLRGDTVIAVDANPDRGTLSDKVRLETAATVRDLLNNRDRIHRYADVRAFTSQNNARLEVLASDRDPAVSEAFSADDYAAVAVVLEQYYSICITDCGTGLLHSAMAGVLSLADQLVLVSSPSVDGARSASATLDWLEAHDHGHLVRNGVVVLSMVRNRTRSQVDLDKLQAHFESRCRAVVRIPYDDHLEEGAEVELEQLAPATREAYLTLAAVVGDGFAYQRPAQP